MIYDVDRLVMVTSQHGEKFLGSIPSSVGDNPKQYIEDCATKHIPIILENVRIFHSESNAQMNQAGQVMGIKTFAALLPIPLFSGPVERMHLLISTWFFPSETPSGSKRINELLEAAEKNEKVSQALEAGIHIPGRS